MNKRQAEKSRTPESKNRANAEGAVPILAMQPHVGGRLTDETDE
jgi:hypothetical protein